jgi:hypothetical protein
MISDSTTPLAMFGSGQTTFGQLVGTFQTLTKLEKIPPGQKKLPVTEY